MSDSTPVNTDPIALTIDEVQHVGGGASVHLREQEIPVVPIDPNPMIINRGYG